jgi:GntR family transcriptional regulator
MNYNAEMPIYLQVIHDLKKKMIQGKILPGEKLPSNRELAVLYKNTAARIYREMETHGYCYTKRGIGTFVMEEETMFETIKKEMAEELLSSFIHEMQDLGFEKDDIISKIADYKEERR